MKLLLLKQEVMSLITRIDQIEAAQVEVTEKDTFTFTKEQLLKFARLIEAGIIVDVKSFISDSDVDIEENIELEFDSYNKQISLDIDEDRIKNAFMEEIEDEMIDDEFIMGTVRTVLQGC